MVKVKKRSIWWRVHSWAGLKLSVLLTFILATGTLATLSNEIDWLLTPAMRAPFSEHQMVAWDAIYRTATIHAGEGRVEILRSPLQPGFAAQAIIALPSGEAKRVWMDPEDGRFTGTTGWRNVQQVLRQLHRRLMLPNGPGYFLVSLFSLFLTVLLVTGVVSYKKFWRGFLKVPKYRSGQIRRFAGDLHRFAALWSIWFMTIIAVTGVLYLFGSVALTPSGQFNQARPTVTSGTTTLDACLGLLPGKVAGLRIGAVLLPEEPTQPIVVTGQGNAVLVTDNGNRIMIDPTSCTVTRHMLADQQSTVVRLFLAANPLHFGTFGGLFTKLLWFAFGCVLTGISVTGSIIYTTRIARDFSPDTPKAGIRWYLGHGRWRHIAFGVTATSLAITMLALVGPLSFTLDDWHLW